jgi:hypothetical protein
MENWNVNDFQGKRKDQVDFSSKVMFYSLIVGASVILIGLLSKFLL